MGLLDLLFPKKCLGCRAQGVYLCSPCLSQTRKGWQRGNTLVLFRYQGVIRKVVLALKYKFVSDMAGELAEICRQELKGRGIKSGKTVLVPIPLHRKRQNWRGFNQAELVGKLLAQKMGWQFAPQLLVRVAHTQPQVGLSRAKRLRNISGKYAVNSEILGLIKRRNIVLFDDVVTTGATFNEAEKILHEAGVKWVSKLAIAG